MDVLTLSFFVTIEIALLLLVGVVLLLRKARSLRKLLDSLKEASASSPSSDSFASIDSGYLPYLEKQLLDTSAHLEAVEKEPDEDDENLGESLQNRVTLLAAEKKVTELCNDYPERRWEHVGEQYRLVEDEEDESDGDEELVESAGISQLRESLAGQGDTLESLDELLKQSEESLDAEFKITVEGKIQELRQCFQEAESTIENLEKENKRLQVKANYADQQSDRIQDHHNQSVSELDEQIAKQKGSIGDLHTMIDGLSLEADAAKELQDKMANFELASRDMDMCVQVLEEENEFLQEQIRGLLVLEQDESVYKESEKSAVG